MRRGLVALAAVAVVAGAAVTVAVRGRVPARPSAQRLDALTRERDALQAKWADVVIVSGEQSLTNAPDADLMIGVPTSLTRSIVEQVVAGVFGQTTLTLENLRVRTAGEVKARALLAKRTVGEYVLEVEIRRVTGTLQAGAPALDFADGTVDVVLPVRLAGGEGVGDVRFRWDSRGLADLVCGDIDVKRRVSSGVVPRDYEVKGSFAVAAVGESIVLRPRFPDLVIRVAIAPSEQTWAIVEDVIRDRNKSCEIALGAIDIQAKLVEIVGRGFDVRVPQKIFAPIRLPAGVSQSLRIQDLDVDLTARPTAILLAGDRLWYGADVTVHSRKRR